MLLLFCGPIETHSSWTVIHLQCWLGHMQFTAGVDQSLGKLTPYWLTAIQIRSVSLAFAHSAWSIIISENFRLDLSTITFQFRTPEPSEVVSVKSYCLCTGQENIVHNLHCFWQIRMISVRSVTDSTYWSLPSRIIGSTRGLLTPGTRTGTCEFVTLVNLWLSHHDSTSIASSVFSVSPQ